MTKALMLTPELKKQIETKAVDELPLPKEFDIGPPPNLKVTGYITKKLDKSWNPHKAQVEFSQKGDPATFEPQPMCDCLLCRPTMRQRYAPAHIKENRQRWIDELRKLANRQCFGQWFDWVPDGKGKGQMRYCAQGVALHAATGGDYERMMSLPGGDGATLGCDFLGISSNMWTSIANDNDNHTSFFEIAARAESGRYWHD